MRAIRRIAISTLTTTLLVFGLLGIQTAPATAEVTDGDVYGFGNAPALGAPDGKRLVGIASSATGNGYWVAAADGGVYAYGDAPFYGAASGLNRSLVGIARTINGGGYWLVAGDGGVFSYGNAVFHGSTGNITLNQPIVGMATTPSGNGYWMVASDGGIFAFGDAAFFGSTGNIALNKPVVGMATTPSGNGYWLVASDGGIFAFGDAAFFGSTGNIALNKPIIGMVATPNGDGYRMAAQDGGIFSFGNAPFYGSAVGVLQNYASGFAQTPNGNGYWILGGPPPVTPSARALRAPAPPATLLNKGVIYSNSMQRVWLVEYDGTVVDSWLVSGRKGMPGPGWYKVHRRLNPGRSGNLALAYFVGFAWGPDSDIGFHAIPRGPSGYIQTEAELGQFRSAGCVRQAQGDAIIMWNFAPTGTPVLVTP